MIDIASLEPQTFARHLGNPEGDIGLAIANRLNSVNAAVYTRAHRAIDLVDNDRILEIGFGNGHLIPQLLSLANGTKYAGLDISETMVKEAFSFNAGLIANGRVEIKLGSSAAIPYADATFDRALALNTVYFWDNPSADLAEIRRVLKPGGRFVLGAISPSSAKTNPAFEHGFKLYEQDEIRGMLHAASFPDVVVDVLEELRKRPDGLEYMSYYFVVSAT
jgi:SAM-dependent methyltransferase